MPPEGSNSIYSHFSEPALNNNDSQTANAHKEESREAQKARVNESSKQAIGDYAGVYTAQRATDPTSLNENQNADYATTGGQYGRFNQKPYEMTLRLARQADAYNNMPVEQRVSMSRSGAVNRGPLWDKRNISTMETRAMDNTIALERNQLEKAQDFQADVNRKNWNAFNNYMADTRNVISKNYELQSTLDQFGEEVENARYSSEAMSRFLTNHQNAAKYAILSLIKGENNDAVRQMIAQLFGGGSAYTLDQYVQSAGTAQVFNYLKSTGLVPGTPEFADAFTKYIYGDLSKRYKDAMEAQQGLK